jgi:hypothetical protein
MLKNAMAIWMVVSISGCWVDDGAYAVDGEAGGTAPARCTSSDDCPRIANVCTTGVCEDNRCVYMPLARGVPATEQVAYDCITWTCWGDGTAYARIEPHDTPSDGNECTSDVCELLGPAHHPLIRGQRCSVGRCNGHSKCVECTRDNQCRGGTCINDRCVAR